MKKAVLIVLALPFVAVLFFIAIGLALMSQMTGGNYFMSCDPSSPAVAEYTEALTRWLNARKNYPAIDHGPEPALKDFRFKGPLYEWQGEQIRKRIIAEHSRRA